MKRQCGEPAGLRVWEDSGSNIRFLRQVLTDVLAMSSLLASVPAELLSAHTDNRKVPCVCPSYVAPHSGLWLRWDCVTNVLNKKTNKHSQKNEAFFLSRPRSNGDCFLT